MKFRAITAALLASVILTPDHFPRARAETQFPKPSKINADEDTVKEFADFYGQIEQALAEEDVDRLISFYAEDYLHHGITKKQLRFMWLEVFSNFEELYSVHVFTKIDVRGDDAILVCTGGLFGIPEGGEDYEVVDRWVTQNHWLTKIDAEWKIIGGATHEGPAQRGSKRMELHPFF